MTLLEVIKQIKVLTARNMRIFSVLSLKGPHDVSDMDNVN